MKKQDKTILRSIAVMAKAIEGITHEWNKQLTPVERKTVNQKAYIINKHALELLYKEEEVYL